MSDHRPFDVEPHHAASAVPLGKVQRDPARPATDVEHPASRKVEPVEDPVHLLGASRREIAFAPERLEEADRGIVVLDVLGRHRLPLLSNGMMLARLPFDPSDFDYAVI
jgi:hypothetical protein